MHKVKRKFRFYPNSAQRAKLACIFGCVRYAYNNALFWRKKSFVEGGKPNYHKSSSWFTDFKHQEERDFLTEVSCVPLQQALRNLQRAYVNFFQKRAHYPKFKKKKNRQSAEFTKRAFTFRNGNLSLSGIGQLNVKWSMKVSDPSSVTITKSPDGRYFVTLTVGESFPEWEKTGESVGIDLGVKTMAVLSDGRKYANPKIGSKWAGKLAFEQRRLSRKKKDSKRREKQREKVAKVHAKIKNSRKDFLDKMTTGIVKAYDFIAVEDLCVKDMVSNPDYAKGVSDCAFFTTRSMLKYKAERYGKEIVVIDRFFPSSKKCYCCGWINGDLKIEDREWECRECGITHERDLNAAINILAAGQAVSAHREPVRSYVLRDVGLVSLKCEPPLASLLADRGIPVL